MSAIPPPAGTELEDLELFAAQVNRALRGIPDRTYAVIGGQEVELGDVDTAIDAMVRTQQHDELQGVDVSTAHELFLLLDGSRPMTGNLDMVTNAVMFRGSTAVQMRSQAAGYLNVEGTTGIYFDINTGHRMLLDVTALTMLDVDLDMDRHDIDNINWAKWDTGVLTGGLGLATVAGVGTVFDIIDGGGGDMPVGQFCGDGTSGLHTGQLLVGYGGNYASIAMNGANGEFDLDTDALFKFIKPLTIHVDEHAPTGFPNRTDTTISFNDGTRTLTVAKTGASFDIYVKGKRYTFTSDQTYQITDTEGVWWFYFNSSGVLTAGQVAPDMRDNAWVALIYWDATGNVALDLAEERHGMTMDGATHALLHYTVGTRWESGLAAADYTTTGDGDSDSDAQLSIADGVIDDEDIPIIIADDSPQNLAPIAYIPVYYLDGATPTWRKTTGDAFPVMDNATDEISYNLDTAGTWTQPPADNNSYVAMWIFASSNVAEPVIAILGQRQDTSLGDAKENNTFESLVFGTIPFQELKLIYRLIFNTRYPQHGNTPHCKLVGILDLRSISNLPSGTYVATAHSSLTGRDARYSHPASAASLDLTNFDHLLSGLVVPTTDDVQAALEVLDDILENTQTVNATWTWSGTNKILFRDGALSVSSQSDGHLTIDADVSIDFTGDTLVTDTYKAMYRDPAIYIYSAADTFLDLVADGAIRLNADTLSPNSAKHHFDAGPTAGDEHISSLADGYMDYEAATQHRFNTGDVFIDNDLDVAGHAAFGGDAAIETSRVVSVIDNSAGPTSGYTYAAYFQRNSSATATASLDVWGASYTAYWSGDKNGQTVDLVGVGFRARAYSDAATVRGVTGYAETSGAVTVPAIIGGDYIAQAGPTASVADLEGTRSAAYIYATTTRAKGVHAWIRNLAAVTLSHAYGVYVNYGNAGTITNAYGLYVNAVLGTTTWAYYNASAANNYMGGDNITAEWGAGKDLKISSDGTNAVYNAPNGYHSFIGDIVVNEDAWIGIAGPAERFVFDGSNGAIVVTDSTLVIAGSNKLAFNAYNGSYHAWASPKVEARLGDTTLIWHWDAGGIDIAAGKVLEIGSTQVVGAQGAAVADATGAGDVVAQLNALLARVRAHGLIAT